MRLSATRDETLFILNNHRGNNNHNNRDVVNHNNINNIDNNDNDNINVSSDQSSIIVNRYAMIESVTPSIHPHNIAKQ